MFQIFKVMNYLKNQNILHRDLKPQNIMLESVYGFDYKSFIKLIDFGYSLDLSPEATLSPENLELILRHIMGTFSYTAPELLEQKDEFKDQFKIESDMWSLGVILFQMVSAKLPFDEFDEDKLFRKIQSTDYGFDPSEFWDEISDPCKDLIEKLLEPNISKRLSPEKALNHPWFKQDKKAQLSSLSDGVKNRLVAFRKPNSFLFICQRIIMSCFFIPESQSEVRDAFLHINTSDSGEITFEELQAAMADLSKKDLLNIIENCCQDPER